MSSSLPANLTSVTNMGWMRATPGVVLNFARAHLGVKSVASLRGDPDVLAVVAQEVRLVWAIPAARQSTAIRSRRRTRSRRRSKSFGVLRRPTLRSPICVVRRPGSAAGGGRLRPGCRLRSATWSASRSGSRTARRIDGGAEERGADRSLDQQADKQRPAADAETTVLTAEASCRSARTRRFAIASPNTTPNTVPHAPSSGAVFR